MRGVSTEAGGRPFLERCLDVPERLALRPAWPADARIAIRGIFGFLKQIARSRALGLRVARRGAGSGPLRDE